MHEFQSDFYGFEMRGLVLGYIRPELDYTSRGENFVSLHAPPLLKVSSEALIDDINVDKHVALNSLDRPEYQKFARDAHFDLGITD